LNLGRPRLPLWIKLTLSGVLVEVIMLFVLVTSNARLAEQELTNKAYQRISSAVPLLNAALAGPLMQRDYGALREILEEARKGDSYAYLVLLDQDENRIVSAGLPANAPLPPLDPEISTANGDRVYDTEIAINLSGTIYGSLRFGISTDFLSEARKRVVRQGSLIGLAAVALTLLTLAIIGYLLTRRLNRLTLASHAIADENFDSLLPKPGQDEVGQLVIAFRQMSEQLKARLSELKHSEQRFFAIAHYTYDMELWIEPAGRTIWVNPSVERMTGYTPDECLALPGFPLSLIAPEGQGEAARRFRQALGGESGEGYQFQMLRKDGARFWAAVNWHPIFNREGRFLGIRASIRDISELKASEERALEYLAGTEAERARLKALLSAMSLGILFVGIDGRVIYHNPAFNHIWRIPEDRDLIGLDSAATFAASSCELADAERYRDHIEHTLAHREEADSHEIVMHDGRVVTQLSYAVRDRENRFLGYLWIYEDVTSERQTAEQLLYLAERDSLTGLYNRHRFQIELERMLAESGRHRAPSALLYFDLDEFKTINDHFGHRAGDALLIRVAGEVSGLTRRNEMLFRLGGDEFAVLMPGADRAQAEALAERIVRSIAQIPFRFEGQSLHISSSLGIAFHPEHGIDQDQLVACADAAMYQAKQAGKNAWRAYRADLDTTPEMVNRLSWNERLARALEHDLFELHFQGVYHTRDRRLGHLEALIRLRDEASGDLIPPGLFIPVAEKSNKILEIDRWVLRQAVRLLAELPHAPPIAVNLSGRSFDDPSLPNFINELLRKHQTDPARLLIEITETAAVSDLTDAERFIEALKQTGCGVCLDDFGAGFASFAYLKHIRVDTIKLDGMFIRNLPHDHDNQVFVRGMVEVARGLGKTTIAECVEDEATLKLLADLGVDKAQGFHLDKPQARHPAFARQSPNHPDPGLAPAGNTSNASGGTP
jgi:diguanylate cyclase (GGDEF)-like protein/PAS domain S-box-containing protein